MVFSILHWRREAPFIAGGRAPARKNVSRMLFYSLVYCFYLLVFLAVVVALFGIGISSWGKRYLPLRLTMFLTAGVLLVWGISVVMQPPSAAPGFPFVRGDPDLKSLAGIYRLDAEATSLATIDPRKSGYRELDATIQLNGDGTFEVRRLPNMSSLWFQPTGAIGYDDFTGRWRATHELIGLNDLVFSEDSPSRSTSGPSGIKPWLTLEVIDRTKQRPQYALAAPLNNGDEGHLIFVKQRQR